jgi:hypothetical protein
MSMRQTKKNETKQRPTDNSSFHSMRGQFILLTKMSENRVRERERERKKEEREVFNYKCLMWIESTNERMNKWSSEWNQYYNWKIYISNYKYKIEFKIESNYNRSTTTTTTTKLWLILIFQFFNQEIIYLFSCSS